MPGAGGSDAALKALREVFAPSLDEDRTMAVEDMQRALAACGMDVSEKVWGMFQRAPRRVAVYDLLDWIYQAEGGPGHPNRGLSVRYISTALREDLNVQPEESVIDIEERIRQRGADSVCPRDGRRGAAYVDIAPDPHAGLATHMLSYTWGYKVHDIVSALDSFATRERLDKAVTRIWICCFCVNQIRVRETQESGEKVSFQQFEATFRQRVTQIGEVLALMAPWHEPLSLRRVWCVFEMHYALTEEACNLHIIIPGDQSVTLGGNMGGTGKPDQQVGNWMDNMARVWSAFGRVRVQDAEASYEDDRRNILKLVAPNVSLENTAKAKAQLAEACQDHNTAIIERLQDWLISAAQEQLEKSEADYRQSCSVAWMLINLAKYAEAKDVLQRALSFTEPGTHGRACVLFMQAQMLRKQKEHAASLDHYTQARKCFEQYGSQNTVDFASNCTGNAILLDQDLGRHSEALGAYKEALRTWVSSGGSGSLDYANVLKHTGVCYLNLGNFEKAKDYFRRSKELFEQLNETDNVWYFDLLSRVAMTELTLAKEAFVRHAATGTSQYGILRRQVEEFAASLGQTRAESKASAGHLEIADDTDQLATSGKSDQLPALL